MEISGKYETITNDDTHTARLTRLEVVGLVAIVCGYGAILFFLVLFVHKNSYK